MPPAPELLTPPIPHRELAEGERRMQRRMQITWPEDRYVLTVYSYGLECVF